MQELALPRRWVAGRGAQCRSWESVCTYACNKRREHVMPVPAAGAEHYVASTPGEGGAKSIHKTRCIKTRQGARRGEAGKAFLGVSDPRRCCYSCCCGGPVGVLRSVNKHTHTGCRLSEFRSFAAAASQQQQLHHKPAPPPPQQPAQQSAPCLRCVPAAAWPVERRCCRWG